MSVKELQPYQNKIDRLVKQVQRSEKTKQDMLDRLDRLNSLLDHIPGMVFRCLNDEELTFEYASGGAQEILGYDPAKIVKGYAFRQLVHREDQPLNRQILNGLTPGNNKYQMVYRMRAADGNDRWIFEQGAAIFSNDGKLEAIEGLLTDVTEQKEEEIKLREENLRLRFSLKDRYRFGGLVGKSRAMRGVYERIVKAAGSRASVIVTGESGTGKELVARAIHDMGDRREKPFVVVNCGAIPENLIESEFFGHLKGSFSGAHADKPGYLQAAHEGTLFLDEIGEMPLPFQVKMLRALDGRGFTPVGDNKTRNADFRLISATNRKLEDLVRDGLMREDFYYRINTVPIVLPPLRERREDIPLLIDHFLAACGMEGQESSIPQEDRLRLLEHDWPGNVRELQNVLNRYLTLQEIDFSGIKSKSRSNSRVERVANSYDQPPEDMADQLSKVEKEMLLKALEQNRWNVGKTAEALGLSRRTLQRRIKKHALK